MKVIEERTISERKAVVLKEKVYLDRRGERRSWSYVERRGGRRAVVVVARTRESGSLVMIRQFRVPFGRRLVELPAGLVDPGESAAEAARRELAEETGYSGEVLSEGPEVSSSAGLTTETFCVVRMLVEERPSARPRPEGSEDIEVFTVAPGRELDTLERWRREGELLDCKAYLVLAALKL